MMMRYLYNYECNCHLYYYRKIKYSLICEQREGHWVFTKIIPAWEKQSQPQEQTQQSTSFLALPTIASELMTLHWHATLWLISSQGNDHFVTLFFFFFFCTCHGEVNVGRLTSLSDENALGENGNHWPQRCKFFVLMTSNPFKNL